MSEEHVKATNEISDAAAVKADIPVEPMALADEELGEVAGGANTNMYNGDVTITTGPDKANKPALTVAPRLR